MSCSLFFAGDLERPAAYSGPGEAGAQRPSQRGEPAARHRQVQDAEEHSPGQHEEARRRVRGHVILSSPLFLLH